MSRQLALRVGRKQVWMLSVNGFLVDIRTMPLEAQLIAYEEGLIPYIPALQSNPEPSDDLDS